MEPSIREVAAPKDYSKVYVSPKCAYAIQSVDRADWRNLFEFIRLNLRSRITGLEGQDLIKLQGKLDSADEIEKLFVTVAGMPQK